MYKKVEDNRYTKLFYLFKILRLRLCTRIGVFTGVNGYAIATPEFLFYFVSYKGMHTNLWVPWFNTQSNWFLFNFIINIK